MYTAIKDGDAWTVALKEQAQDVSVTSNLTPEVTKLADVNKTSYGLANVDLEILQLDLLGAEQIQNLKTDNKNNVHELTVAPNNELNAKIHYANHALLGVSEFTVTVFKENDEGDFVKWFEDTDTSGGVGGVAKIVQVDLGTLDEGNYIVLLSHGTGLDLVSGVAFNLIDQELHDYSAAVVEGNLATVDGQAFNGEGKITKIGDDNVNAEDTVITGVQGKLTIKQDGTYSYKPNENAVSGSTETFEYTLTDSTGEKTVKGMLTITIQEV